MLVQLHLKFAADEVKIRLMCVDRAQQVNQAPITVKGHAASREVQHLLCCLRYMVGGIGSMQSQLYGAEKLDFALLRFVSEAHSLSFALRKAKACGAVRRRQAGLMVKRYVAGCDLHQARAIGLLGLSGPG